MDSACQFHLYVGHFSVAHGVRGAGADSGGRQIKKQPSFKTTPQQHLMNIKINS